MQYNQWFTRIIRMTAGVAYLTASFLVGTKYLDGWAAVITLTTTLYLWLKAIRSPTPIRCGLVYIEERGTTPRVDSVKSVAK